MIRMNLGYEIVSSLEDEIFENELNIHPNPSNGIFKVEIAGISSEDRSIAISNVLGEVVYFEEIKEHHNTSKTIDISHLGKGIYLVELQGNNTTISRKIAVD